MKIGHGGTLDPMATGVLVVGIGAGTKRLTSLLGCDKEYTATAMFGASTDTYDRLGKITKYADWRHLTREMVEAALVNFRGDIMQAAPMYSALNMNGKRLYKYARAGEPLPGPIPSRPMTVFSLELDAWKEDHEWELPTIEADDDVKNFVEQYGPKKRKLSTDGVQSTDGAQWTPSTVETRSQLQGTKPPIATFSMRVSGGFYVRSFIHELGLALGSAAHMVSLNRTRQAMFALGEENTIEWKHFGLKLKKEWEEEKRLKNERALDKKRQVQLEAMRRLRGGVVLEEPHRGKEQRDEEEDEEDDEDDEDDEDEEEGVKAEGGDKKGTVRPPGIWEEKMLKALSLTRETEKMETKKIKTEKLEAEKMESEEMEPAKKAVGTGSN